MRTNTFKPICNMQYGGFLHIISKHGEFVIPVLYIPLIIYICLFGQNKIQYLDNAYIIKITLKTRMINVQWKCNWRSDLKTFPL